MEFVNGNLVIEKADFEPFCSLLFDSLLNDLYLLREVELSDYSKKQIDLHVNRVIAMIRLFFDTLRVEKNV